MNNTSRTLSAFVFLFVFVAGMIAAVPGAPGNLRVCNQVSPLGTSDRPYFGWQDVDEDQGEIQTAYQIQVGDSKKSLEEDKFVWNSGKVKSRYLNYIYMPEGLLQAARTYYWKVRSWDKDGQTGPYSVVDSFTVGLNAMSDWKGAKWICRNSSDKDDYSVFTKDFHVTDGIPSKSVLYLSASHEYKIFLNGKSVGMGSDFHYPQFKYYQAWDITSALKPGAENQLKIHVHWYGGGQGRASGTKGMLMKAKIMNQDGSASWIVSDSSWTVMKEKQFNSEMPQRGGEGIGRVELMDARLVGTANPEKVKVLGEMPVKPWVSPLRPDLTHLRKSKSEISSIKKISSDQWVVDLGKIRAGNFRITFPEGHEGDTIQMRGGYILDKDGQVNRHMTQSTNMSFYFVLGNSPSVFEQQVYLGTRYLQIDRYPFDLKSENIVFEERNFDLNPSLASFNSSDATLNAVWDMMVHSLASGSQEEFVDTPTREKGGFLGDGWSQAVPAMTVLNDRRMNDRVLEEFMDSQDQYWPDGRYNAVYPNVDGKRDIPDYTQQYLFWVWDYYMQTGNADFLRSHYQQLKKTAQYVADYIDPATGLIVDLAGGKGPYEFGIIDWPSDMRFGYDMNTKARTVINAYAVLDFQMISTVAALLGHPEDSKQFMMLADNLEKQMNLKLINSDGLYVDGLLADGSQSKHVSQHSNMLPLVMNLVPESNYDKVIELVKSLKMSVGMVTLRWLPESLGLNGQGEHLYDLYTNKEGYGWANILSQGATFTWESWNAPVHDESMSHPWGVAGLLAMQNYFLGVKTLLPQNLKILVQPLDFKDKLHAASGIYHTDAGPVNVKWERSVNSFTLDLEVPVNVETQVLLPLENATSLIVNGKKAELNQYGKFLRVDNLGSGKYHLVAKND